MEFCGGAADPCETLWNTIRETLHSGRRSACGAEDGVSFPFMGVPRRLVKRCGTPFGERSTTERRNARAAAGRPAARTRLPVAGIAGR